MKKVLILIFINFLLLEIKTHRKRDCIMKKLFRSISINDDLRRKFQAYYDIRDFNSNINVEDLQVDEILEINNFATQVHLEEIIMNFSTVDHNMRTAILECNLSMKKVMKLCKETFPNEGCFLVDQYTVAKKCPEGQQAFNMAFCAEKCPSGYEPIEDDFSFCKKSLKSNNAQFFVELFKTPKIKYRMTYIGSCPPGFRQIDNDICIRKCPFGWEDYGEVCKKPFIKRRENEIFVYRFALDNDDENDDEFGND